MTKTLSQILEENNKEKIYLIEGCLYLPEIVKQNMEFDREMGDLLLYKSKNGKIYAFTEEKSMFKYCWRA